MVWYLAEITSGAGISGFETGRHVYVHRTPDGRVFVLGRKGITAVLALAKACQRLRTARYADGRPVRVANQQQQRDRWYESRSGRMPTRFDRQHIAAA